MAVYKQVTSKSIIRKVMRDLKPTGDNWIDDAIEWMGEALEHIGASPQLVKKVCVVSISNYSANLPSDLYYINQVAINNAVAPTISTELTTLLAKVDVIKATLDANPDQNVIRELRDLNNRIVVLENLYTSNVDDLQPLSYATNNFPRALHCDDCSNELAKTKESYFIDGGTIKTSFVSGKICLSYTAFPVDGDGYPMLPDDVSFKEAMFWYIYKKLLLSGFQIPNGINYGFADQKWMFYCTQARNSANFPDIDRYESFLNQWVRLIPNMNRHEDGFETLNDREQLSRNVDY